MCFIQCKFHKKDIRNTIGCMVCWAAKIHDPMNKTHENCINQNWKPFKSHKENGSQIFS